MPYPNNLKVTRGHACVFGVAVDSISVWLKLKIGSGVFPVWRGVSFLLGYSFFRLGIEFFRQPDEQLGLFLGFLTLGQIFSLIMAGLALGFLYWDNKKTL